ncbi:MAG TPA: hypothetical protein VM285_09020 [Polyangia bacterium]|nr:hypothetical protein [Polyangia bacterium]
MYCQPRRIATHPDGSYTYQCRRCHREIRSREPAEKVRVPCPAAAAKPKKRKRRDPWKRPCAGAPPRPVPRAGGDPHCCCQIRDATAEWLAAGKPRLSDADTAARLAVCEACEHWPQNRRIAMSLGMPTIRCPLGKFPPAKEEDGITGLRGSFHPLHPVIPSTFPPVTLTGKLAVCAAYFNPARYATRRANFARFRDAAIAQGADLWVVEAETGPPFEVDDAPGMHVLRLPMKSVLWQKERALNVLIAHLPPEYDRVAWVDGDLLFDNPRWVAETADALERYRVVQSFDEAIWLDREGAPHKWWHGKESSRAAWAKAAQHVQPVRFGQGHPGFAWAARRNVIRDMGGLYDRHILGSGDSVMAIGFYGWLDHPYLNGFLGKFGETGKQWLGRAFAAVGGDVGYIPGVVRHLWHGSRDDRRYDDRISRLALAGFDPAEHLEIGPSGLWQWSPTAPPEIRELVETYFAIRREDG